MARTQKELSGKGSQSGSEAGGSKKASFKQYFPDLILTVTTVRVSRAKSWM